MAEKSVSPRQAEHHVLRHRMRRQAQGMALIALLMLLTTFSVPFVLAYLEIKIP